MKSVTFIVHDCTKKPGMVVQERLLKVSVSTIVEGTTQSVTIYDFDNYDELKKFVLDENERQRLSLVRSISSHKKNYTHNSN